MVAVTKATARPIAAKAVRAPRGWGVASRRV